MSKRISDITVEHLGDGATDATVDQFRRACDAAIEQHPNMEEEGVIDFIWNDGQFDQRIRELLGEEVEF